MPHKFKVVAFDVDGTLIKHDLWRRLNLLFGISYAEDEAWFREYLDGKIDYARWMVLLGERWASAKRKKEDVYALLSDFEFLPHARELLAYLNGRYHLALISNGLDAYVSAVAEQLQVPHLYFYTKLVIDDGGYVVGLDVASDVPEYQAKVDALKDLEERYRVSPEEMVFIGDSKNDLAAFEYTRRGILVGGGDENLRRNAWRRVSSLKEIYDIL